MEIEVLKDTSISAVKEGFKKYSMSREVSEQRLEQFEMSENSLKATGVLQYICDTSDYTLR